MSEELIWIKEAKEYTKYLVLGVGNICDIDTNTICFEYKGKRYEPTFRELIDAWFSQNAEQLEGKWVREAI